MSKRRRDTGSPFLQSLCEDETLTSFHKLLLNKFDSIISFLQRIDEKVYSIDKRLSYLELKDKESPEHDRKTERTESPPLPQNPPPVSINHPPVVIHNPVTVSPVQIPAESHHRPSISDLPSTSASAAISTTIIKEEFVDDDESSHSIMEIEDLQNLAAKSEAIEIEDVSYILPEGSLNDTNSSYTHHERESMDGHSHQVFPQGSFNCLWVESFFSANFPALPRDQLLENKDRTEISKCLVRAILNCDNQTKLDKYHFMQLADEICRTFVKEHPSAYYVPYGESQGSTAKGKLFEQYNKYRQQLGKQGIIKLRERKKPHQVEKKTENPLERPEVVTTEATIQMLEALSECSNHFMSKKFLVAWDSLFEYRTELVEAKRTPSEFYEIFPCLKNPSAYELAFHDSVKKYKDYARIFIPPNFSEALIAKIAMFYRSKDNICKVLNIMQAEEDPDKKAIISVSLLPLVYNPGKKCSKIETFERFIQIKDSIEDVVFEELGPTIAFLGQPITKAILKIEDNLYEFDSIRTCMEAYCAFNLAFNFPFLPRCRLVWFFVRRHLFNISKKGDKEGDTLATAHDLGLM